MIVCADDFNMCPAHDNAILELAGAGRVSAVSVMIAMPHGAPHRASALRALHTRVDIGLHLVLTDEGVPCSRTPRTLAACTGSHHTFYTFGGLATRAYHRRVDVTDARLEIEAQIRLFHDCFGATPDFLDGHLHVQQLPGIRTAVAEVAAELCRTAPCYVRHAWTPLHLIPRAGCAGLCKQVAIGIPGAGLHRLLRRRAVPSNHRFFGVYDYHQWRSFPEKFMHFAAAARHVNDIIMTHPGRGTPWRELEFAVLRDAETIIPNRFQYAGPP